MSFLAQLRKDKMTSMKNKDKLRTGVISNMMSGIALAEKEQKRELTDEEALKFVQKELKQTRDALEMLPKDRTELIEEAKTKIGIIESYLPAQLSVEEVVEEIRRIAAEKEIALEASQRGSLIKETLSQLGGKTEGKVVNQALSKLL